MTAQLPRLLGTIAGVRVAEPPRAMLGRYLTPGDPDAVLHWLRADAPADASDYIVSTDMMVYGGLVASRIPGVARGLAYSRIDDLAGVRARHRDASFALFGTVVRLAPTGVPALGDAATFPFAGAVWPALLQYAKLPDPPATDDDRATAARLRAQLGPSLDAYLGVRARNLDVDLYALRSAAEGRFDRVILGQDDAGPVGLHLHDLATLRAFASRWLSPSVASIEPGADELAMVLVSAALVREAGGAPRVRVIYSRSDGGTVHDPIEFAPVATTIADVIRSCGGTLVPDDAPVADVHLYVRVPGTSDDDERRFVQSIATAVHVGAYRFEQHSVVIRNPSSLRESGRIGSKIAPPSEFTHPLVAVADLSFLAENDYAQQRRLTGELIGAGVAGRVDAFASWNTVANTVGTALPEAFAAYAGRRLGTYDARANATFTLMRYIDDVAFHTSVRPQLNSALTASGTVDHTYLTPGVAQRTAEENRALLWPQALDLLAQIAPQFRDAGLTITLPWDRTFETELDVRLAPR